MSYFSENLNPAQLEAVEYCDGPSLVIAGAGSGKTRVLTFKIAYLLQNGLQPWNILALTFTNKAAREMNERIAAIVGTECTRQLWSGTFHSIFSRILHRESERIGYRHDFTIYDTADSRSLIKSIIKEMGFDDKQYKPSTVAGRISEAKNNLLLPAQYAADASIYKRDSIASIPETRKIYAAYDQRCRRANAMDFDDLLLNTYLLFRNHPDVCEAYRERFQYILVDEYQDTNSAQHCIIRLLTRPDSRICVVGDDAQSIYGFRGADIDNILQFGTQFPTARIIKLERNYRSTQNIVGAANAIIRHNANQIPKEVYSEGDVGERLQLLSSYSDKEESAKIAGEIRRLCRRDGLGYGDIALLYRTNAQSRAFEEAFRGMAIPYRIWGGLSFYQRKEIKDVIAYLRLIGNPSDEEAFKRVINYPARGIGATTLGRLTAAASEHEVSLWDVLCNPAAYGVELGRGALVKLNAFHELIENLRAAASEKSAYEVAVLTVRASGIGADIHADLSPENLSKQENVEELLNSIKGYEADMLEEEGRERVPLNEFLTQVSLLTDADQRDDGSPKVTLMTIHAAKGLEFDTVFITGLEEDLFPNANARMFPREMEEERRLFYVAVTRAKRRCFLSYAKSRYRYGRLEFGNPSTFINEIPDKFLATENGTDFYAPSGLHGFPATPRPTRTDGFGSRTSASDGDTRSGLPKVSRLEGKSARGVNGFTRDVNRTARDADFPTSSWKKLSPDSRKPAWGKEPPAPSENRPVPTPATSGTGARGTAGARTGNYALQPGQAIEHERFGRGRVLAVEGTGDNTKACVEFENAGTKNLLLKFARFKVL